MKNLFKNCEWKNVFRNAYTGLSVSDCISLDVIREGFFRETDQYFTVPGILHAGSCSFDWNQFAVHNFYFEPRFIEKSCIVYRDGTKLAASLNNSQLSEDAIPSVFAPDLPLKIQTRNQLLCRTNCAKCSCFKMKIVTNNVLRDCCDGERKVSSGWNRNNVA